MSSLINVFVTFFGYLIDYSILGMPVIVWLVFPALVGLILKFIEGKR